MRVLRTGEDIGTFVRTLDRRDPAFDPRVVRAVWDALRAELRAGGTDMPLQPGDRIAADLGIDWEEVEFDVLPAVAARTGRSLAIREARRNPMYRRVRTVVDLIRFIALQPRAPPHNEVLQLARALHSSRTHSSNPARSQLNTSVGRPSISQVRDSVWRRGGVPASFCGKF
jgi:hypothetical protein